MAVTGVQTCALPISPKPQNPNLTCDKLNMDGEQITTDPAAPELNADGSPIGEVIELIPEEIRKDMEALWSVFDMDKTDKVNISELRVIMRALDFDLNAAELAAVRK